MRKCSTPCVYSFFHHLRGLRHPFKKYTCSLLVSALVILFFFPALLNCPIPLLLSFFRKSGGRDFYYFFSFLYDGFGGSAPCFFRNLYPLVQFPGCGYFKRPFSQLIQFLFRLTASSSGFFLLPQSYGPHGLSLLPRSRCGLLALVLDPSWVSHPTLFLLGSRSPLFLSHTGSKRHLFVFLLLSFSQSFSRGN